jgi:hypothetical protein
MAKAKMTVEIEFEAKDYNTARATLIRTKGNLAHDVQHGNAPGIPTGVISDTVKVTVKDATIDDKAEKI